MGILVLFILVAFPSVLYVFLWFRTSVDAEIRGDAKFKKIGYLWYMLPFYLRWCIPA